MRVIVTGSRAWKSQVGIWTVLDALYRTKGPFTLIHGACPTGADAMADDWARFQRVPVERHPADWDKHGNRAGPIRNAEMVEAGADLVLAFPLPGNKGTQNTIDLARAAGIEVREYNP